MKVPGVFWVVLIVIGVPALIPVLQQVFPSSNYAWSAIIVVMLAALAKTVEIVYKKPIEKAMGAPLPMAAPRPIGEYEHTVTLVATKPSAIARWLIG